MLVIHTMTMDKSDERRKRHRQEVFDKNSTCQITKSLSLLFSFSVQLFIMLTITMGPCNSEGCCVKMTNGNVAHILSSQNLQNNNTHTQSKYLLCIMHRLGCNTDEGKVGYRDTCLKIQNVLAQATECHEFMSEKMTVHKQVCSLFAQLPN